MFFRKIGSTNAEVGAYEDLSVSYFYLGDLERSKYYHDRAFRGALESRTSLIRKHYEKELSQRNDDAMIKYGSIKDMKTIFDAFETLIDTETNLQENHEFEEFLHDCKYEE
jgi:hypothetical protein